MAAAPVAGRIRWFFYRLRPYLRAYIVEDDLTGTPFSFEAHNLVHARARGEIDTRPFGTERDFYDEGYHWLQHSIAPAAALDEDPRVLVGNDLTSKPYSASILNVSAMSFGSLSAPAVEAMNMAAISSGRSARANSARATGTATSTRSASVTVRPMS